MIPTAPACELLAEELQLGPFDLMLVGDGSGMTIDKPCGWHVTAYHRPTGIVTEHFGGTGSGTNNYAELMPYIHAMWVSHTLRPSHGRRVAIVSDSELTVRCGNRQYLRNANLPFWAAMDWFESIGYLFTWRHIYRGERLLNILADKRAKQIRLKLTNVSWDG